MSRSRSIVTSEIGQQATMQLFLWCFSSLSGGLVHSSKNTNIAARLSTGLSGVNFTTGRIKACNCSGIACFPGHAYSVAGPWEGLRGQNQIPNFSPVSFSALNEFCSFSFPFASSLCLTSFPRLSQAWREQRRLISAAEVKRETRAWSWGPGSP